MQLRKTYIKPVVAIAALESCPFMAGSDHGEDPAQGSAKPDFTALQEQPLPTAKSVWED